AMSDGSMEDCPMMGTSTPGPERALDHRAELALTPDQVDELESLASEMRQQRAEAAERMQALLTPEQAEQLADLAGGPDMSMRMRMMHGQGDMRDCPMMGEEPAGESAEPTGEGSR